MKNYAIFLLVIGFLVFLCSCKEEKTPLEKEVDDMITMRNRVLNEKILAKVHAWPIVKDEIFISELKYIHPAYVKGDIVVIYGGKYMVDSVIVLDGDGHYTGDARIHNILEDDE